MSLKETKKQEGQDTEARILEAAKDVFLRKGKTDTNMQEIADEAGINRTLLHYYFRSKDKLFEAVFRQTVGKFIPDVQEIFNSDISLFEKIEIFADRYIQAMIENPFLPLFVMTEINRNPEKVYVMIHETGVEPMKFAMQVTEEVQKGNILPIDPRQLIVNMISMCIFPVAGRPIIKEIIFSGDDTAYDRFLQERRKEVARFVINAIKAK
ncbi:MAG: TetR/AcrR family transcriptional regulator [Bacteroidetes bacterium]|nr:TetR/AcrR family transcriptional regulator [Bacteroidota bacterium]